MSATFDQLIDEAVERKLGEKFAALERMEAMLALIAENFIVPQQTAATLAGVDRTTLRRKVKAGELEPLSTDTSRRNYFTIKCVKDLKPVRRRAK